MPSPELPPQGQQLSLFDEAPAPPAAAPTPPPAAAPTSFVHPQSRREIQLGEHRIGYALERKRRRSIGFVIGDEGLRVSAPRWVGQREIDDALREKAAWILRKLHDARARAHKLDAARVQWREGGSLPFLGEPLVMVLDPRVTGAVLQVSPADALPGLARHVLHIGLPQQATPEQMREAVQSWLQRQARRIFEERCAVYAERLHVRVKRLTLSSASTRWGSASADGSIRLNWRLVHFAVPVIDYVVAHELAHLREMNHSAAFWDVVRSVLPDYEHARGTLREQVLPALE